MKKVSIIILTYNNLYYTKRCLESIFTFSNYPNLELIIVDNNSHDGTKDYLEKLSREKSNIKLIFNDINKGFSAANNQGIKISTGDIIILLNNDTVVTKNWISSLLKYFDDRSRGMVGPVSNYTGTVAEIELDFKTLDEMHKKADIYTSVNMGHFFEVDMLSFFCVAIGRDVIEKVGLLDENFEVGFVEDEDYSLRVKKTGFKIIVADDIYIYHEGSSSFKNIESEKFKYIIEKNKKYFENKWKIQWLPRESVYNYLKILHQDAGSLVGLLNKIKYDKAISELSGFQHRLLCRIRRLEELIRDYDKLLQKTQNIYNSRGWKIITFLHRIRKSIPILRDL